MSDKVSVKPCPYGHASVAEDIKVVSFGDDQVAVSCTKCGAIGPVSTDVDGALENWNHRTIILLDRDAYDAAMKEYEDGNSKA